MVRKKSVFFEKNGLEGNYGVKTRVLRGTYK